MVRQRLLPTLTWHPKGLMQPWPGPAPHGPCSTIHGASSEGCTHPALVLPQPTKAPGWAGGDKRDQTDPSGTDSPPCITAGYFPQQEKLIMVLQDWGREVKSLPE